MRWLLLFFVPFILYAENSLSVSDSTGTICVSVVNVRNNEGKILIALYNSKESFESSRREPFKAEKVNSTQDTTILELNEIPFGEYAVMVLHDENLNDKMDYNFIHLPTEGFGSSSDKAKKSKPVYKEAKFMHNKKISHVRCQLVY